MEGLSEVVYPKDSGLPPSSIFTRGHVMALYCTSNHSQHYVLQMLHFHAFTIQQLTLGFAHCVCDHWQPYVQRILIWIFSSEKECLHAGNWTGNLVLNDVILKNLWGLLIVCVWIRVQLADVKQNLSWITSCVLVWWTVLLCGLICVVSAPQM